MGPPPGRPDEGSACSKVSGSAWKTENERSAKFGALPPDLAILPRTFIRKKLALMPRRGTSGNLREACTLVPWTMQLGRLADQGAHSGIINVKNLHRSRVGPRVLRCGCAPSDLLMSWTGIADARSRDVAPGTTLTSELEFGVRAMTGDPISAAVTRWQQTGGLGVAYTFANGSRTEHEVGQQDWLILERLDYAGRLSFATDTIRRIYRGALVNAKTTRAAV